MQILAIVSGEYGKRHVENINKYAPKSWKIHTWEAPTVFPLIIDYPEDYLPHSFHPADLILSFGENKGVAELLPDIAKMTGAEAVIAALDNEAWLPRGLARQLCGWLEEMNVACATPKPLCSLTGNDYGVTRWKRQSYDNKLINEFASHFGQPELQIEIDPNSRSIISVQVLRDAVCGNARYVAEGLIGVSADDAEEKAGLFHHHYPCMASMGKDIDFNDTLMHISGNVVKDNVAKQVKPHKRTRYIAPGKKSE